MKELLKELEELVKLADKKGDDPDRSSWIYQIGVVITVNQTKQIIELLTRLNKDIINNNSIKQ